MRFDVRLGVVVIAAAALCDTYLPPCRSLAGVCEALKARASNVGPDATTMIDSSGDPISGRGVGCWRLLPIQARRCMLTTVHLRRDRRKEEQQQLASYMTEHDGDVVGFGDTRLGENAGIMDRLTKRAMIERREERQRQRDTSTTAGRGQQTTRTNDDASVTVTKTSWSSAGSSKNRNDAWLGGVTMAAVGEAAKRQQQEVVVCGKWGRYLGRIYRGKNKKTMVVVQVYFPDAQYSSASNAESYSQLLPGRGEGGGGDTGDAGGEVAAGDGAAEAGHSATSASEATADGRP